MDDATKEEVAKILDGRDCKGDINLAIKKFIEEHGDIEAWRLMARMIETTLAGESALGDTKIVRMELDKVAATLKLEVDIRQAYKRTESKE